ncbi:M56 family metallopeptidase [Kitasatospora sp. NPDC093558]|uniref:M56 family metallopeptidase n=1 Tax=Kitasatospora sp. NPDC093558 TaxID=3155201 RepID=UPI003413CD10
MLAAGVDPDGSSSPTVLRVIYDTRVRKAYDTCVHDAVGPRPWLLLGLLLLLLLVAAGLLYWVLPLWRERRRRLVLIDPFGFRAHPWLLRTLEELVARAGVETGPRFMLDPVAVSASAVVFGRRGRYTVSLNTGLVAGAQADPEGFRAVVLHELAHLRNRDVDITYATVALWRVFLIAVLLPNAGYQIEELIRNQFLGSGGPFWSASRPAMVISLAFSAFLVVLVLLARADVLRSREIYADLEAVRRGADQGAWTRLGREQADRGRFRRALAAFGDAWRTHPRWRQRQESLVEPAALFGVQAMPMFLTGAAAMTIGFQLSDLKSKAETGHGWMTSGAVATAVLIAGVAGVALWRAAVYAALTDRRPPSGTRAGLWIGLGTVAATLALAPTDFHHWLPAEPAVLLTLVGITVLATHWTAAHASLSVATWRGSRLAPVAVLSLAVMCCFLALWMRWWLDGGLGFTAGTTHPSGWAETLLGRDAAQAARGDTGVLTAVVPVWWVLFSFAPPGPFAWISAVLWLVALPAWWREPGDEAPRWLRRALPDVPDLPGPTYRFPSTRRLVRDTLLGALLSLTAGVAVMAVMHAWWPQGEQVTGYDLAVFWGWLIVALAAASLLVATVVAVTTPQHAFLTALVTTGGAGVLGLAACYLLTTFDGCLGPLNVLSQRCTWTLAPTWQPVASTMAPYVLAGQLFAAAIATILVLGVRRLPGSRPRPLAVRPTPRPGNHGRRLALGWAGASTVAVLVTSSLTSAPTHAAEARPTGTVRPQSVKSAVTRGNQEFAWMYFGGKTLFERFSHGFAGMGAAVAQDPVDYTAVHTACTDLADAVRLADDYFPMPNQQTDDLWEPLLAILRTASADCIDAADQKDPLLFQLANVRLLAGGIAMKTVADLVTSDIAAAAQAADQQH